MQIPLSNTSLLDFLILSPWILVSAIMRIETGRGEGTRTLKPCGGGF